MEIDLKFRQIKAIRLIKRVKSSTTYFILKTIFQKKFPCTK